MGKRREPEKLEGNSLRQTMLRGISDPTAVLLFDQAMETLEEKGQADFIAALQLRDAAQWTVAINEMQDELHTLVRSGEADEKRIAAIIKNKQAAEDARRRILDGLLLTPQKKRGRPEENKPQREDDGAAAAADDAWAAFDERTPPPQGMAVMTDERTPPRRRGWR